MADRGPVKIREARIRELEKLYESSLREIFEIIHLATTARKIRLFRSMSRINRELESLGKDVNEWTKREIPQYYLDGANQAAIDLRKLGVDTSKAPAAINRQAIEALVSETSLAFAEGIRGVSRNARRVLTDGLRQQINLTIASGRLTGEARKTISDAVESRLRKEGLTALVDSGGKRWELNTYSRMLVRTKAAEARNQGLMNRMAASGYDLVQVSRHFSKHDVCRRWEGEILSITGKSKDFPSFEEAKADGLFHPNCEHAVNVINVTLARKTKAYDAQTGKYIIGQGLPR